MAFSLKKFLLLAALSKSKGQKSFYELSKKKRYSISGVHLMPLPLHPLYRKYNSNVENVISTWKDLVKLAFFS